MKQIAQEEIIINITESPDPRRKQFKYLAIGAVILSLLICVAFAIYGVKALVGGIFFSVLALSFIDVLQNGLPEPPPPEPKRILDMRALFFPDHVLKRSHANMELSAQIYQEERKLRLNMLRAKNAAMENHSSYGGASGRDIVAMPPRPYD